MNTRSTYTAINASAGSGKTYTLAQKIIVLCLLQKGGYDAIQHILALTFTNKAANEMKERILSWMKDFTKEDYSENNNLKAIQSKIKELGIDVSLEELHERSQKILDYILHHYSTLNIGTIDKFNAKLIRSFSYELGLPHQFNLEIQSEPYLIEAVDRILEKIGQDEKISEAFMDLVEYNLENEDGVHIHKSLYERAKTYLSDTHYNELKKNEQFDWEAYYKTKTELRKRISTENKRASTIAQNALQLIKDKGLQEEDFQDKSSSIAAFFKKYLHFYNKIDSDLKLPDNEEKKVEKYRKGSASKNLVIKNSVLQIVEDLIKMRQEIISIYVANIKREKILKELLPFKFNKEIQDQLHLIETENDLLLLSRFNMIINKNLKNEPTAFIYEKIGAHFQHFFIDEFQDTSKIQWENFLPLKENTIATEGNSFTIVGDPKQSIYSFRGGDSEIMLDILNHKEKSIVPVHIEYLNKNWRSAQNIVHFNNALFSYIAQSLEPEHRKLFSTDAEQIAVQEFDGRVKVNLTDYDTNEVFYENSALQMHQNIQECLNHGYSLSDICILCRTKKEIQTYSSSLGSKKVNYKGQSQYIKTISDKGLTLDISTTLKGLIAFLQWQQEPENLQHLVKWLYYLQDLGRIEIKDFTQEMAEIIALKSKDAIEEELSKRFSLEFNPQHLNQLNLYNYIEYHVLQFSVEHKEQDFILNFLEFLFNYCQNPKASLSNFIHYWEEEADNTSIQASENIDAVHLMTIHAAKGLEFPVVFIPMLNSNRDFQFNEWWDIEDNEYLKSINISNFSEKLAPYDEQIEKFNRTNTYKNKIDRLCLLYVALTRAEQQLFLYLQRPSKSGKKNEVYDYLSNVKPELTQQDEFDFYPSTSENLKKITLKKEKTSSPTLTIQKLYYPKRYPKNIKIATPSKNYQNRVAHVREGIFTHDLLSKIKSKEDIYPILELTQLNGVITKTESKTIEEKLRSIIESDSYSKYFQKNLPTINERDISINIGNETKLYRPDRLVQLEDGWYIIDYKTGQFKEEHQKQVNEYRAYLEAMGWTIAGTEVIYI